MDGDRAVEAPAKWRVDGRFVVLGFCVLVESVCGFQYLYGSFSDTLKHQFSLTQDVVDRGSMMINIGNNAALHIGVLIHTFGSKKVIRLGAAIGLAAFGALYLSLRDDWPVHDHQYILYVILFFYGQAQTIPDMAVIPVVAKTFPENAGLAIGLCKSFLGLSGSLMNQVFTAFFKGDTTSFICFLTFYFFVIVLICSAFIHEPASKSYSEAFKTQRAKTAVYVVGNAMKVLFVLLVALFASALIKPAGGMAVVSAMIVFSAFFVIIFYIVQYKDSVTEEDVAIDTLEVPLVSSTTQSIEKKDIGLKAILLSFGFWFQCTLVVIGWGSALMVINNIPQYIEAAHVDKDEKYVFVSLVSIFNCIGRITAGFVSDIWVKAGKKRTTLFGASYIIMGFALSVISTGTASSLYISIPLVGFLLGCFVTLSTTIITDLYGEAHVGILYSFIILPVVLGSFLIATELFTAVYNVHAKKLSSGEDYCDTTACIELSSQLCAILCTVLGGFFIYYFERIYHTL